MAWPPFSLSPRERAGVRGNATLAVHTTSASDLRHDSHPKGCIALSHSSFQAFGFAEGRSLIMFCCDFPRLSDVGHALSAGLAFDHKIACEA